MFTRAPKYVTHAQGTNVLKLNIFDVDRSLGLERDTYIMECVGTTNIMICVDRRSCFSIVFLLCDAFRHVRRQQAVEPFDAVVVDVARWHFLDLIV